MTSVNIWKTLFFFLLLGSVLFAIESIIRLGINYSSYSHYYKVNLICNGATKPQVAVFGSSVGEVGINTPQLSTELSQSCYNFSIDGTRFLQYNGLVREHATQNDSLKLVIFAETAMNLENNNALTSVDRYVAHIGNNNIYQSLKDVQPDLAFKVRFVPFYKFIIMEHPYYKASMMGWLNKIKGVDYQDLQQGYTPRQDSWQVDVDELNRKSKPYAMKTDSLIISRYQTVLTYLKAKNIKTLIVFMPIYIDGQKLMNNMDGYRKVYTSFTSSTVSFYDTTVDTLCANKRYFYNNSHVNTIGSELLTGKIANFIQNKF